MNKSKTTITILAISILFIGLCLDWIIQNDYVGLRRNTSESLPFSYFISFKGQTTQKGSYVSIDHPKSPSILLAKKIIGVEGDTISISNQHIFINGEDYGVIRSSFTNGASLTPIQQNQIPSGYVFVYAPHPSSFDSRYEDFGLVNIHCLKEVLWPLF